MEMLVYTKSVGRILFPPKFPLKKVCQLTLLFANLDLCLPHMKKDRITGINLSSKILHRSSFINEISVALAIKQLGASGADIAFIFMALLLFLAF